MPHTALSYEEEPLAEALAVQRVRGAAGPVWIAARIGQLAVEGDVAGVTRFRRIAAEYERLLAGGVQ